MEAAFLALEARFPICKSQSGKDVTRSARALYNYLEVKTPFTMWLDRRVEEYGFVEGKDFITFLLPSTGGRPETDAAITVDMAKELAMVERNEKGRQIRQYFIWAETKLRQQSEKPPIALPTDFAQALRLLADSVEDKARLQHQLEQARPKVAFFDAVALATNAIPMSSAAAALKIPGVGRNLLFRMLRRDGILKKSNEPFAAQIAAGHFEVEAKTFDAGKDGEKGKRLTTITRVTPQGLQYLAKRYRQV